MIFAIAAAALSFSGPASKLASSKVARVSPAQMFTVTLTTPDGTSTVRRHKMRCH